MDKNDGVKWLEEHGFIAQDDEPCYSWSRRGVTVNYDEEGQSWSARCSDYMGEWSPTPSSALSVLRVFLLREHKSLLNQATRIAVLVDRL